MSATIEATQSIAERPREVLTEMGRLGISPSPENYHVWYHHLGGTSPALTRAINKSLQAGKVFTEDHIEELYERYVANEKESKALRRIHLATQTVMRDILQEMTSTTDSTSEYKEKLNIYSNQLGAAQTQEEFQDVIRGALNRYRGDEKSEYRAGRATDRGHRARAVSTAPAR